MVFQVLLTAEGIGEAPGGGPGHGVDGEIPPGQIAGDVLHKFHPLRVAVVEIGPLGAEGGDLHHAALGDHAHGAVLLARQNQFIIVEDRFRLVRQGGGAKVIVRRFQSQQAVPDAPAHGVCSKARFFQSVNAGFDIGW